MRDYIHQSRSIIAFHSQDSKCFFRCLAFHLAQTRPDRIERDTNDLLNAWKHYKSAHDYRGVFLTDLPELEHFFEINIRVYSLKLYDPERDWEEEESEEEFTGEIGERRVVAQIVKRSKNLYYDTMNLNLHKRHFSYIKNLSAYCKSWKCQFCGRVFRQKCHLDRHEKDRACSEIKHVYPGGGFRLKKTIFEILKDEGIEVPEDEQYYPFRAVYDFECLFKDIEQFGIKQRFKKELIPASFSVVSNVPGYDVPQPFVNGDPQALVGHFYNYLCEISQVANEIVAEQYDYITSKIQQRTEEAETLKQEIAELQEAEAVELEELAVLKQRLRHESRWFRISKQFDRWLRQLPVLGFNSGKFDLNLIRQYFIPTVFETDEELPDIKVTKRGNNYMCINMENLLFLDISNYLAAGTSYDKWIKAFQISQTKGMWPYEWFTNIDQLEQTFLPDKASFFSTMKQKNITDEDYEYIKSVWRENGFRNMRDYLIWYNDLDVYPFLSAAQKMFDHFKGMKIDMFKQGAISLPGLAMVHMFSKNEPEDFFILFSDHNKLWHTAVRENIVGGPSIIFTRHHEANVTRIRGGKLTKAILGYDANALYLSCTGREMPVGLPTEYEPMNEAYHSIPTQPVDDIQEVMRKINENMEIAYKRTSGFGQGELSWVTWQFRQIQAENPHTKLTLMHRYNGGQKSFLKGKTYIPVDGYIPELEIILQYHGCYFHGHVCQTGKVEEELRRGHDQATKEMNEFLGTTGCKVIIKYECEFAKEKRNNHEMQSHTDLFRLPGWSGMKQRHIVSRITDGSFFGLVECDIQVKILTLVSCTFTN